MSSVYSLNAKLPKDDICVCLHEGRGVNGELGAGRSHTEERELCILPCGWDKK